MGSLSEGDRELARSECVHAAARAALMGAE